MKSEKAARCRHNIIIFLANIFEREWCLFSCVAILFHSGSPFQQTGSYILASSFFSRNQPPRYVLVRWISAAVLQLILIFFTSYPVGVGAKWHISVQFIDVRRTALPTSVLGATIAFNGRKLIRKKVYFHTEVTFNIGNYRFWWLSLN